MTSKPKADGRGLGPPLALAGLGVVAAAVIAGFVIVGGPGDARDRRLDDMKMSRISSLATAAQCAASMGEPAPADLAGLRAAVERASRQPPPDPPCPVYDLTPLQNDVEYSKLADDRIRLCADFRRAHTPADTRNNPYPGYRHPQFLELESPRPAGRHCYDLQLIRRATPPS